MTAGSEGLVELKLPDSFFESVQKTGACLSNHVLWIRVADQRMILFRLRQTDESRQGHYERIDPPYPVSTSKFGIGQQENSNQTPLGLHRIAEKIGGELPRGTIFRGRKPIGNTADGQPNAMITDRILWLDGLELGFNRGGNVDSYQRYIYIHGTGDESTIGRPHSHGCTHLAADDLIPLFEIVTVDTLVFISER